MYPIQQYECNPQYFEALTTQITYYFMGKYILRVRQFQTVIQSQP